MHEPELRVSRWRSLIWAISLALVLVLALSASTVIELERRGTLDGTARTEEHLTQLLGLLVDQMIRDVDGLADGLKMAVAVAPSAGTAVSDESWTWFAARLRKRPAVRSFHLLDRHGRVARASRTELIGQDMSRRMHFTTHRSRAGIGFGPEVSDPFISPTTGYRQLLVSWPLHEGDGRFAGVIAVGFDTEVVERRLGRMVQGADAIVALVKDDRVILAASGVGGTQRLAPAYWDQGLAALLFAVGVEGHEQAIMRETTLFGTTATWLVDVQPLQTMNGSIIAAQNVDILLAQWRWHGVAISAGAIFLALAIIACAAALTGLLDRQRRALIAATTDALTDPLTRLFNRRMFEERAAVELATARATGNDLALLLIDIDRFKQINDRYGHAAGDAVLVAVAACLKSHIRRHDLLARIGGEEVAVLLPGLPLTAVRRHAERLRRAVEALRIEVAGRSLGVTVSVGVTLVDQRETTLRNALDDADRALYAAKSSGRNRTVLAGDAPVFIPRRLSA